MKGKTHIAGGIGLGYLAFNNINILNVNLSDEKILLLATAGLTLGALLPDIDHPNSKISNKVKPLGFIVSKIFKHRGFTHSILGAIIMTIIFGWIFSIISISKSLNIVLLKSLTIGITSHILLDMMTPTGVCLLYPYEKRYNIANFKMGSISEMILVAIFIGLAYFNSYQIM